MPLIQRPGLPDLHYLVDDYTDPWRDAPWIFLQHGYGRSAKFWYAWIPYLARHYRVVRADLRGLGQSGRDFDLATGLGVGHYLDDMEAVLDAIGAASVHYCGESLGGILGLFLAALRPQRVRTLSLVSTPVYLNAALKERSRFGEASWEDALRKLGARGYAEAKNTADRFPPGTDPGLMRWFADEQGASDVEVLIAMQKLAAEVDATPVLNRIEAPVLAISPSEGPIATPEHEELLRRNVRTLSCVHLPSRFHNLHNTQPAACATHVLHFAAHHDGLPCHE